MFLKRTSLLQDLSERLSSIASLEDRCACLDQSELLSGFSNIGQTLRQNYLLKQLYIIRQMPPQIDIESMEEKLWQIDQFYREIGGLVGYQAKVLSLLKMPLKQTTDTIYHAPSFVDISKETPGVMKAIRWGIEAMAQFAEMYPIGGAADRLNLVDLENKPLPAAMLSYLGRSLLEGLIRDVMAREHLYYQMFGQRLTTPIAMMTSEEKDNHRHVVSILEDHEWFGRPKESYFLFVQPLVPVVDQEGNWYFSPEGILHVKPGGHGAIWKRALDAGVFSWLKQHNRTKLLVRQINNPIAGLDYGLLAFTGFGVKKKKVFGFASCPRRLRSAEGVNVVKEIAHRQIVLTNIEYCDFGKYQIEDAPLKEGDIYSRFSSNTNLLFADLQALQEAVQKQPFPGLLLNHKPIVLPGSLEKRCLGRLESTMQNIADVFVEPKRKTTRTRNTFVTYNLRHKTIATIKRGKHPEEGCWEETPEHCFYMQQTAAYELFLNECDIQLPKIFPLESFIERHPHCVLLYHPALGPLYRTIRKKLKKGRIEEGSLIDLEISQLLWKNVSVRGALCIQAKHLLGAPGLYGSEYGSCRLLNVHIENKGVDWTASRPFWRCAFKKQEALEIRLLGHSKFTAENVCFRGAHFFEVPDQTEMVVSQKNGRLVVKQRLLAKEYKI